VHQVLPSFSEADAIGSQVVLIRRILRAWGYSSDVFAEHIDPRLRAAAGPVNTLRQRVGPEDVLLVHYSIGSEIVDLLGSVRNPVVLIYHNITPSSYFEGINDEIGEKCARGRDALPGMAGRAVLAVGVSEFNRQELVRYGFKNAGILPLGLAESAVQQRPDARMLGRLSDGRINLLHVGRISPNKRIEDLIKIFYFYRNKINPQARLLLAGSDAGMQGYALMLREMSQALGLRDVHFLGRLSQRELCACYRRAHVHVSMSEHEGFCMPLIEAMSAGIPVVAYAAGAVPETLGGAGVLVHEKRFPELAEVVDFLVNDSGLRRRICSAQRERAACFTPSRVAQALQDVLRRVHEKGGEA
jgi:glycosyltransferase involved in cell wall biosynthesis